MSTKWNDMSYVYNDQARAEALGYGEPPKKKAASKAKKLNNDGFGEDYKLRDDVNHFTEGRKPGGFDREDGSMSVGFNADKQRQEALKLKRTYSQQFVQDSKEEPNSCIWKTCTFLMWLLILAISAVLVFLTIEHVSLREEINKSNKELFQKQNAVDLLDQKIDELEPQLQQAEQQLSDLDSMHKDKDSQHILDQEQVNKEIGKLKGDITEKEKELDKLKEELDEVQKQQKKFEDISANQMNIITRIRYNKEIGQKTAVQIQSEIDVLKEQNNQLEQENEKLQHDVDVNAQHLAKSKEEYDAYMSVPAITDLKLIYAKDKKSALQQAAGAGPQYQMIEQSINDGATGQKLKGYLAYKVGKRSDGYITDILALSHPNYFNQYSKNYGEWQRVLTLNNGGPDNVDPKKRKVYLWYVKDNQYKSPGFSSLTVKMSDKTLIKLGCNLNESNGGKLLHLFGTPIVDPPTSD